MGKIKVNKVKITSNDITIKYSVTSDLEKFFFVDDDYNIHYYKEISNINESVGVIPFLTLVLPIAWITDSEIEVNLIDKDFYECIPKIQMAVQKMYPQCNFMGGKLLAKKIVKNELKKENKSSMFFSGGVDSLSTLISVKKQKPSLVTIWGSDIWLPDKEGWNKATQIIEHTASNFNLETYYIKSNFRNVIRELVLNDYFQEQLNDNWWHGVEHGLALLGHVAPYANQYGIKKHYIPATYCDRDTNVTCASYPTIDESLKFCGCSIIHEGFDKNRQQKLTNICNYCKSNNVFLAIRACYIERGDKTNCCVCEKCYRTIMGIVAEKQNPRDFGFDISDKQIRNIRWKLKKSLRTNKKALHSWLDIQQRCIGNRVYFLKNRNYRWILKYNLNKVIKK